MLALLYFMIIYFYSIFLWVVITRNIEFFNMLIPGIFAVWLTYYLIINEYLSVYIG